MVTFTKEILSEKLHFLYSDVSLLLLSSTYKTHVCIYPAIQDKGVCNIRRKRENEVQE